MYQDGLVHCILFWSLIFITSQNVQGFYGTLTKPNKNQERKDEGMNLELHPQLKERLKGLCSDPKTTVVVLSRSEKSVLDQVNVFSRL